MESEIENTVRKYQGRITLGSILVIAILGAILFRVMFVNFVDNYELGYQFDKRTGKITIFTDTIVSPQTGVKEEVLDGGYFITPPFLVKVHTIDIRPMQVCINANSRVLNCKLVKFDPRGIDLFLSWHGRASYSALDLNPILMSYAYDGSGKNYPFLEVIRELKPEDSDSSFGAMGIQ